MVESMITSFLWAVTGERAVVGPCGFAATEVKPDLGVWSYATPAYVCDGVCSPRVDAEWAKLELRCIDYAKRGEVLDGAVVQLLARGLQHSEGVDPYESQKFTSPRSLRRSGIDVSTRSS